MNQDFNLVDESTMDLEDLQVERDLQLASVDAIRKARSFGTPYVIWEDEQVKQIPPDQTEPYEKSLLAIATRLDRRIAELRSQQPNPTLNDHPSEK